MYKLSPRRRTTRTVAKRATGVRLVRRNPLYARDVKYVLFNMQIPAVIKDACDAYARSKGITLREVILDHLTSEIFPKMAGQVVVDNGTERKKLIRKAEDIARKFTPVV